MGLVSQAMRRGRPSDEERKGFLFEPKPFLSIFGDFDRTAQASLPARERIFFLVVVPRRGLRAQSDPSITGRSPPAERRFSNVLLTPFGVLIACGSHHHDGTESQCCKATLRRCYEAKDVERIEINRNALAFFGSTAFRDPLEVYSCVKGSWSF